MVLILGIDDAGRGPLIGPMILAGVLMEKKDEKKFKSLGVTDSKLLNHAQRIQLEKEIKSKVISYEIVKSSPDEIDDAVESINLNTLEAKKAAEVINIINKGKYHNQKINIIIDCPSNNILSWKNTLIKFIKYKDNLDIKCEHKADFNHPSVSAASILAKCVREEEVAKIKEKYKYCGDTGSGYPSDPNTIEFLKKNGKKLENSGIFRKSWSTWKSLFPGKKQATLGDFNKD